MTKQWLGVSKVVRMIDIEHLSDPEQDDVIKATLAAAERDLGEFVGGTRPIGDLIAQVTGPHTDTILGLIYVHTVAGPFDVEAIPLGAPARAAVSTGREYDPTLPTPDHDPDRYKAAYQERYGTTRA